MLKHKLYREDDIIVKMDKKTEDKPQARKMNRLVIIAGAVILVIVLLVLLITQLTGPKRSVAAYCQTYKEEKGRLAKLPGNTWPSGVFNDAVSDAGEFAVSFGKLEKVAPDEVAPDVKTLQGVYQKIHDDPSQAIGASLSGASADSSVKRWTADHCSTTN
jgi:hypothetical protein